MTKATHYGECQICGSRQLLPGGTLAKHGYTVAWGFFSGVCSGSGHLPFETSKGQIEGAVKSMESSIATVEADIAELENIDSETNGKTTAWKHVYHARGYVWEQVKVIGPVSTDYSGYTSYQAVTRRALSLGDRRYEPGKIVDEDINVYCEGWNMPTLRHWVHFLNCKRAASLRKENESRCSWVKWQNTRCASWALQPLVAR